MYGNGLCCRFFYGLRPSVRQSADILGPAIGSGRPHDPPCGGTLKRTDHVPATLRVKKVDDREGLLYDDFYGVVAVVRRHRRIHHNGLRDRIATRSCRS